MEQYHDPQNENKQNDNLKEKITILNRIFIIIKTN